MSSDQAGMYPHISPLVSGTPQPYHTANSALYPAISPLSTSPATAPPVSTYNGHHVTVKTVTPSPAPSQPQAPIPTMPTYELLNPAVPLAIAPRPLHEREIVALELKVFRNSSTHPRGAFYLLLAIPGIGWLIYLIVWKSRSNSLKSTEEALEQMTQPVILSAQMNRAMEIAHPDHRWMYALERGRSCLVNGDLATAIQDFELVATTAPSMPYEACYLYAKARELYAEQDTANALTHYKSAVDWYEAAEAAAPTNERRECRLADKKSVCLKLAEKLVQKYKLVPETINEISTMMNELWPLSRELRFPHQPLTDLQQWVNLKYRYKLVLQPQYHSYNFSGDLKYSIDAVTKQLATGTLTPVEKREVAEFLRRLDRDFGQNLTAHHLWSGPWTGTKAVADLLQKLEPSNA